VNDTTNADWFSQLGGERWARRVRHLAQRGRQRGDFDPSAGDPGGPHGWRPGHRRPPFGGSRFAGPGFGGPGFGRFGGFFGPGSGRGPRMRRGDVRAAILALLKEQQRNGYQIIQEIERRSGGLWRPSAGAVYPALQQLEDEGLIEVTDEGGRRELRLTDAGRAYADEHPDELAAPWASVAQSVDEEARSLFEVLGAVGAATIQVGQAGSEAQIAKARKLLGDTRKGLYRILAEEEAPKADTPTS